MVLVKKMQPEDCKSLFPDRPPLTDLVSTVTDQLTAAIVDGRLRPGERLGEERVARELGVSRAPVREAARLLVQRGLLVAHPRRGFFVRSFSRSEVDDLFALRLIVERHAAGEVAMQDADAAVDELELHMEEMGRAAADGDSQAFVDADMAFHRTICRRSGNARLVKLFDELAEEMRVILRTVGELDEDKQRLVRSHVPILDAIRSRDAQSAREAMAFHVGTACSEVRRLFEGISEKQEKSG